MEVTTISTGRRRVPAGTIKRTRTGWREGVLKVLGREGIGQSSGGGGSAGREADSRGPARVWLAQHGLGPLDLNKT